jgi:hypothetical protein
MNPTFLLASFTTRCLKQGSSSRSPRSWDNPHSRSRMLGQLWGSVKGRVVLQWRAVELPVHHQPDDCNQREDKRSRTQEQHDRKDRTSNPSDLSFDRISQHWGSPSELTEASHGCGLAVERIATVRSR